MRGRLALELAAVLVVLLGLPAVAAAQQQPTEPGWPMPMNNNPMLGYAILNQNELRTVNGDTQYRWDGEGWYGGNLNRAWFKSEGFVDTRTGQLSDTEVQALYSRAISTFFNLQAGGRYVFGNVPGQGWAVVGVEGLSPFFFDVGAHLFIASNGNVAARLDGHYDMYITQRLVLQPQIEINFYTRTDARRGTGSGLSDIDSGLRLRYEFTREFAPYVAVTYSADYGGTAQFAREVGQPTSLVQFAVGVRLWL